MTTVGQRALALGLAAAILALATAPAYALQAAPKAKININTAPAADLEALPRIGPKVAQRIVDFRTKNGGFKRIEDIMKVQGIGEKIFDEIKELITVGAEAAPK
jgi:comEA protein